MDCDMVLSLAAGRVLEYAPPAALLGLQPYTAEHIQCTEGPGLFQSLVAETGSDMARKLTKIAARAAAHTQ